MANETVRDMPIDIIAIGRQFPLHSAQPWIAFTQGFLHGRSCQRFTTVQTTHGCQRTVQLGDSPATGQLLQAVDILGNRGAQASELLQARERMMGRVGQRPAEALPAEPGTRPVALARRVAGDEVTVLHGFLVLPCTVPIAVIRNPRGGADAGAGQHEDTLVIVDELLEAIIHVRSLTIIDGFDR